MYKLKKMLLTFLAASMMLGLLTGCPAQSSKGYDSLSSDLVSGFDSMDGGWGAIVENSSVSSNTSDSAPEYAPEKEGGSNAEEVYQSELRIIKSGSLNIESTTFDETDKLIRDTAEQMGGLITDRTIYGSTGNRTGSYTVRIPSDSFDQFFDSVVGSCTVIQQSVTSDDVTEQYVDLQTRLETNQRKYDRLLELLDKAETLTDVYSIQSEISDVEYEINTITGTLNGLDSRISYSTISVELYETRSETAVGDSSFGSELKASFENGLSSFRENVEDFLISAAYALPSLLLWLAILVVVFFVIYRLVIWSRESKRKRLKMAQEAWEKKQEQIKQRSDQNDQPKE